MTIAKAVMVMLACGVFIAGCLQHQEKPSHDPSVGTEATQQKAPEKSPENEVRPGMTEEDLEAIAGVPVVIYAVAMLCEGKALTRGVIHVYSMPDKPPQLQCLAVFLTHNADGGKVVRMCAFVPVRQAKHPLGMTSMRLMDLLLGK
jgi:hypothetical protein